MVLHFSSPEHTPGLIQVQGRGEGGDVRSEMWELGTEANGAQMTRLRGNSVVCGYPDKFRLEILGGAFSAAGKVKRVFVSLPRVSQGNMSRPMLF